MVAELDIIFLGTGTSSAVPFVGCLTSEQGCLCCKSTLTGDVEGRKNIRRNISVVIQIPPTTPGQRKQTLLIDCGKTFYSAALEQWPKHNLREIDAVLLTHPHSDAILGLDDLRGWTLQKHIQSCIDIYATQATYDEVAQIFPYLVDSSKATGGGDVPMFKWHIFDPSRPLDILGLDIVPLLVEHGKYFTTPPRPYHSLGFLIDSKIAYLSDVSSIPDTTWRLIEEGQRRHRLAVTIMDCLRVPNHQSHFGLPQAVEAARRLHGSRTYLAGFGHLISHAAWVAATTAFSKQLSGAGQFEQPYTYQPTEAWQLYNGHADPAKEDQAVFRTHALKAICAWEGGEKPGFWLRPGCDGMKISIKEDKVTDSVYD